MTRGHSPYLRAGTVIVATVAVAGGLLAQHAPPQLRLRAAERNSTRQQYGTRPSTLGPADDRTPNEAGPLSYQNPKAAHVSQAPTSTGELQHEELLIMGDPFRFALPNSWLEQPLVVRTKPGRPVTFEALDSGAFENGEITIMVEADGQGVAATRFYVTNLGDYRVLADSPESAGPAEFSIRCVTEGFREDLISGRHAQQYLAKERALEVQRRRANEALAQRIQQQQ